MRTARTQAVALTGTDGHLVTIEADITAGLPTTVLVGLPDTALREARDRIRAAIVNSGEHWPGSKITVSLYPASLPKRGSAFDLAIAVAVMTANGDLPEPPDNLAFLAELGLDGRLRPVPGALPAVLTVAESGLDTVVVATGNHAEAALAPGVTIIAADSLAEVSAWLRGGPTPQPELPEPADGSDLGPARPLPDLADVPGQPEARLAAEICAAGGHHLSLAGPPGTGKSMLAERLPGILPPLDTAGAIEVTSIRSAAGMLDPESGLVTVPPFCAPHHTSSMPSMIGGGSGLIRPGQVSLAHRGVLFLENAPEFHRSVLDSLRQPLETGEVVIVRGRTRAVFPARFILVLAADPCPCANAAGLHQACSCSPAVRRRYLARVSGPLLDRIDVKVRLRAVNRNDMLRDQRSAESSSVVAQRVAAARERAAARLAGTPWRLNTEVPGTALRRSFPPQAKALILLDRVAALGQVSARGTDKIVRVAWSLADLAGKNQPGPDHVNQAIGLWLGSVPLDAQEPPAGLSAILINEPHYLASAGASD
jgi:magnesium chelatase family protein